MPARNTTPYPTTIARIQPCLSFLSIRTSPVRAILGLVVAVPTGRWLVRLGEDELVEDARTMRSPQDPLDRCPLARTASIICDVWTPLIIRDLAKGPKRFTQLQRSVTGISPKTLSTRLKQLEQQGVIQRLADPASARPRYELTPKGQALVPLIRDMRAYGRVWLLGDPAGRRDEGLNPSAAMPAR